MSENPTAKHVVAQIIEKGSKRWLEDKGEGFGLNVDLLESDLLYELDKYFNTYEGIAEKLESRLAQLQAKLDAVQEHTCNQKVIDQLQALLGKERDEFGKKETELLAQTTRYRECLESISKNSCCASCQEAGRWAKSALEL